MAVYIVTGKLGSGKTLVAVSRIREKLLRGLPVVTNLNLKLYKMPGVSMSKKARVMRVPDKPSVSDLEAAGRGNFSYDESLNGLLVLDECGTWFNSRSWSDKERQPVINWFLHARKLGWDIIFIIQDISIMDKQARLALAEHVVYCRRSDRLPLPFIGFFITLLSSVRISLPCVHFGIVKYGDSINSLTVDRWIYRGRDLYNCYDTKQVFSDRSDGCYCLIPPYFTHGQFAVKKNMRFFMKMTHIYFRKVNRLFLALSFFALGAGITLYYMSGQKTGNVVTMTVNNEKLPPLYIVSSSRSDAGFSAVFSDGTKNYYSSDLVSRGYSVSWVNPCIIRVSGAGERQNVLCR